MTKRIDAQYRMRGEGDVRHAAELRVRNRVVVEEEDGTCAP